MTHVRNFLYVAVAVAFVMVARTGSGITADVGSYGGFLDGKASEVSHEAAESETRGAKFVVRSRSALVYADTVEQVAKVEWAVGRFAEAGLELPEFEVHYFSDSARCRSDSGRERAGYLAFGDGEFIIYNCGTVFTLLHEMAHVWDVHSLDDETREQFMAERNADSWTHDKWALAGGEHLADVLAWGLQDGNVRPSRTLPNDDDSLYRAFVIATGSVPFN